MDEFGLIQRYFDWKNLDAELSLGVGDDCAIFDIAPNYQLLSSVDTLIEGVHFSPNTSAGDIAYKALAVNLSDLAAMGATPKYFTLALTLPAVNSAWLRAFSYSLKHLAQTHQIALIGGDTTKGALSITINVLGQIQKGAALLRSSAKVGEAIFVSNTLGDAALAWQQIQNGRSVPKSCLRQLNRPEPRILLGRKLLGLASACIDISDGLTQDLVHILDRSGVGAEIDVRKLPLSNALTEHIQNTQDWCLALAGGDDYELCFTVAQTKLAQVSALENALNLRLTQIGVITNEKGLRIKNTDKSCQSYRHF